MEQILLIAKRNNLWVVEDACQAHLSEYAGQKVGSFGIAGAFSFYPGKNLGACGEGGAVITNDFEIVKKVMMLRDHGQSKKYYHTIEGYNGRCDALQAAALRIKLKYISEWNKLRIKNAQLYMELLSDINEIILPKTDKKYLSVFHLFIIMVKNRNLIQEYLSNNNIATGLHYPIPLHLQESYNYMGLKPGSFPITEKYSKKLLSLPMYPELTVKQITYVADCLKQAIKNINKIQE